MKNFLWWVKQIAIGCMSVYFLSVGINVLIGSYGLENPLEFIMYFFSSSMLILVSATFLLYPVLRIYYRFFKKEPIPKVMREDSE